MKLNVIAVAAALALSAGSVVAQDNAGGASSAALASGEVTTGYIAAGVIGVAVAAAIVSNSSGVSLPDTPPPPVASCNGTDPLVGGVCTGTSVTNTVTMSGTGTTTATVPVTFTYAPTVK